MRKCSSIFILMILPCLVWGNTSLNAPPKQVRSFSPGTKGTVLIFVSSLCPCTDAHRQMVESILNQTNTKGINFYLVFSNKGESTDFIEYFYRSIKWDIPYILDTSGILLNKYKATHTPQAFVLSPQKKILYRGPIDDSNLNQGRVDKAYLKNALQDVLAGRAVKTPEVAGTGCWIVRDTNSGIVKIASDSDKQK